KALYGSAFAAPQRLSHPTRTNPAAMAVARRIHHPAIRLIALVEDHRINVALIVTRPLENRETLTGDGQLHQAEADLRGKLIARQKVRPVRIFAVFNEIPASGQHVRQFSKL